MGQYYRAVVCNKNGRNSHVFSSDGGLKLMKSNAYFGCAIVDCDGMVVGSTAACCMGW